MLEQLHAGQRRFVRLLPALLSLNHKSLPGYVGGDAAGGIQGYVHGPEIQAELLTRFNADIKPAHRMLRQDVLNVSLMGSIASIGHGADSDIDVWVIHRPDLPASGRQSLQRRLAGIERWSASLGIRTQCFLVNPQNFSEQAPLVASPNALLLDEYLRTATMLAGGYPVPWLVDPDQDENITRITETLNGQLPPHQQLVDFGPLQMPPATALVEHALAQLAASIESPWKALLKLNLAHHYAEHPDGLLSREHRRALVHGQIPPDPYLALYRAIAPGLSGERLEFVQRSLYLKTGVRLSFPNLQIPGWQHAQVRDLVKGFGWDPGTLAQIDHAQGWSLSQIRRLHQALVDELTQRFHSLADQCRWQGLKPAGDRRLDRVARQLYARFEAKPGKLTEFHPALISQVAATPLSLTPDPHGSWRIASELYFHSRTQALVWCHINGVCGQIKTQDTDLAERGWQAMDRWLPASHTPPDFEAPARVTGLMMVAPSELDWIEVISRNSWGETRCIRYTGPVGLRQALCDALSTLLDDGVEVGAFSPEFTDCTTLRGLVDVLREVAEFFARPDFRAGSYAWQMAGHHHALSWDENQPQIEVLDDLMEWLARPRSQFHAVSLHDSCVVSADLARVIGHARPGTIRYYIRQNGESARIWCSDERGAVMGFEQHNVDPKRLVEHLQGFTQRLIIRRQTSMVARYQADATPQIELYALDDQGIHFQSLDRPIAPPAFVVAAHGRWSPEGEVEFEIQVGSERFSALSHGPDFMQLAAQTIRGNRASGQDYPAHLTDLSLPRHSDPWGVRPMQTVEYLRFKQRLENELGQYNHFIG